MAPRRGRPPRTDEQRAAQRARLVDAAMDAIRRDGPEISIDDFAVAAGVSKPVLYDEFGGKLGLADAIALVLAERLQSEAFRDLAASGDGYDVATLLGRVIESLIDLIDAEPEIYAFLVRSIRASDRGFLDNAFVRVIHDRAWLVLGTIAPGIPEAQLAILTDGLFGFLFAAVESWNARRQPSKDVLARTLTSIVTVGVRAAADELLSSEPASR